METMFKDLANKINVQLNEKQIDNFFKYKNMLIETNKKFNLTAITDDKEIIIKHFIDSLIINKYINLNTSIIDVGTGAGFPGIPIKIVRDDLEITLLDSLNKRLNFLNDVIKELDLKNIKTLHGRAEDIGHNSSYREKYDYVTARAVANLSTLSELCIPFLKVNGIFICMKGNSIDEVENAQNAINKLGGEIINIEKLVLPNSDIERNIILIKKIKNTPTTYSRKAGIPNKEPIK